MGRWTAGRLLLLPLFVLMWAGTAFAASLTVNENAACSGVGVCGTGNNQPCGLEVDFTTTSAAYVENGPSGCNGKPGPWQEKRYRARFHVRFSEVDGTPLLSMQNGDDFQLFQAWSDADAECPCSPDLLQIRLRIIRRDPPGENRLEVAARSGGTLVLNPSSEIAIPDGYHTIEIDWKAADPGLSNGFLNVWLDDVPFTLTSIADLNNADEQVDCVRWGALGTVEATTSGVMHLDEFESRRESYIGGLVCCATGGAQDNWSFISGEILPEADGPVYLACDTITAGPSQVIGETIFHAANKIVLKDGFSVASGAKFTAKSP